MNTVTSSNTTVREITEMSQRNKNSSIIFWPIFQAKLVIDELSSPSLCCNLCKALIFISPQWFQSGVSGEACSKNQLRKINIFRKKNKHCIWSTAILLASKHQKSNKQHHKDLCNALKPHTRIQFTTHWCGVTTKKTIWLLCFLVVSRASKRQLSYETYYIQLYSKVIQEILFNCRKMRTQLRILEYRIFFIAARNWKNSISQFLEREPERSINVEIATSKL